MYAQRVHQRLVIPVTNSSSALQVSMLTGLTATGEHSNAELQQRPMSESSANFQNVEQAHVPAKQEVIDHQHQ
jgi:hypothetical protein